VLLDMEADGFALDMPYLDEVTSEYGVKVMEGWDEIVTLTGNPELNPQSPAQILEAFASAGCAREHRRGHAQGSEGRAGRRTAAVPLRQEDPHDVPDVAAIRAARRDRAPELQR
jgi:hypothetical protein